MASLARLAATTIYFVDAVACDDVLPALSRIGSEMRSYLAGRPRRLP